MPYIGNTIRAADDYRLIDDISSGFNGSATSFALQVAGSAPVPFPKSPQQVLISVNGVIQEPDPTGSSGFNLVGTNIVFSSAPTNGHAFFGIIYATADYLNAGGNFPAGSLGAPSITFIGDENTGLFRKSGGSVGFVSDATEIANFDSNGITISSGNIIIPDSIIHNGDTNTKIRFPAADTVTIETAGNEAFRIDSGGKVGIGTASISNKFHVKHTDYQVARFENTNADANGSYIEMYANSASPADNDTVGLLNFKGNDDGGNETTYAQIKSLATDVTNGSEDGAITFGTRLNGTFAERLRINSSGNVGIGTASPSQELTVAGSDPVISVQEASVSSQVDIGTGTSTGFINIQKADGTRTVQLSGSTDSYFTGGRVGIGTTAPSQQLHVTGTSSPQILLKPGDASPAIFVGDSNRSGDGQHLAEFRGHWNGTNVARMIIQAGDDTTNKDNGQIVFMTSATGTTSERLRINESGDVGINESAPSARLHVNGGGGLFVERSAGTSVAGFKQSGGSSMNIYFQNSGSTNHPSVGSNNQDMTFGTNNNERMRIASAGQLLIGHTSARNNFFGAVSTEHTPLIQLEGTNQNRLLSITSTGTQDGGIILLARTNGNAGANNLVANGNVLGRIDFQGNDGTHMEPAAQISCEVDGTTGNNDMPGRLLFKTSADGGTNNRERMRIVSDGTVQIADNGAIGGFASSAVTTNIAPLKIYKSHGSTHAAIQLIWDHFNTTASIQQRIQFTIGDDASSDGFNNAGFIGIEKTDSWQSSAGRNSALVFGTTSAASESEKMRLDNAGRFIIGRTSTAASDTAFRLQVFAPSDGSMGVGSTNTSASGTATINLMPSNSVTGSQIKCTAEEDFSSSANRTARLGFFTRKDGTLTERLRLTSDGDLRFGNVAGSNTSFPHQNNGGTSAGVMFNAGTDSANYAIDAQSDSIVLIANKTQDNGVTVEFKKDATVVGSISVNSSNTSYNTSSDYRLKENIVNITDGITRVKQLTPRRFNWISDDTNTLQDGFLAHEAQTVVPEAVQGVKDEIAGADYKGHSGISEGDPVYQEMDHSKLVPLLTAALQEEIAKREALETRIAALEAA